MGTKYLAVPDPQCYPAAVLSGNIQQESLAARHRKWEESYGETLAPAGGNGLGRGNDDRGLRHLLDRPSANPFCFLKIEAPPQGLESYRGMVPDGKGQPQQAIADVDSAETQGDPAGAAGMVHKEPLCGEAVCVPA
ncbi:MAG TPA: hypothetical protein VG605_24265 [Puia sp.]|nr:hypothetical protein [Puia sp.]